MDAALRRLWSSKRSFASMSAAAEEDTAPLMSGIPEPDSVRLVRFSGLSFFRFRFFFGGGNGSPGLYVIPGGGRYVKHYVKKCLEFDYKISKTLPVGVV